MDIMHSVGGFWREVVLALATSNTYGEPVPGMLYACSLKDCNTVNTLQALKTK